MGVGVVVVVVSDSRDLVGFRFFFLVGFARPELSRDRLASERPLLLKCWSRVGNGYTLWQCHRLWYIEKVA